MDYPREIWQGMGMLDKDITYVGCGIMILLFIIIVLLGVLLYKIR